MGKPMIAYAIEAALDSKIFDEVMVSTDDAEIVEVAKQYGAIVPFMRSEKTSNDYASTYDVLEEVILEYKKQGKEFDYLCCIYPCVPFLKSDTLKIAYDKFCNCDASTLVSIVKFGFPIQRAFRLYKNNVKFREPEHEITRSQDLEFMYHDVGMFYFKDVEEMLPQKKLITDKTTYIVIDEKECQDIDTPEDWELAEMKYKILNNSNEGLL